MTKPLAKKNTNPVPKAIKKVAAKPSVKPKEKHVYLQHSSEGTAPKTGNEDF
jgi:hypothetical protein